MIRSDSPNVRHPNLVTHHMLISQITHSREGSYIGGGVVAAMRCDPLALVRLFPWTADPHLNLPYTDKIEWGQVCFMFLDRIGPHDELENKSP